MKEVIQVGVDRYMDVYTRDLKERTRVGDMRGMVYRHLKGGWRLSGRLLDSEQQYIWGEDGNLSRDSDLINDRLVRFRTIEHNIGNYRSDHHH